MRSLTRSTMRLSTSAWRAGQRVQRRARLTSVLRMGFLIRAGVSERQIPLVNHDIVTGSGLLDQRLEEAVGARLAQLGDDLAARLRQRHHLGGLALGDLEDVEAVLGRYQGAHLARLQREDDVREGG